MQRHIDHECFLMCAGLRLVGFEEISKCYFIGHILQLVRQVDHWNCTLSTARWTVHLLDQISLHLTKAIGAAGTVQIQIEHSGHNALSVHQQLLGGGSLSLTWGEQSVSWLALVNSVTVTTGRKSPGLLIKGAASETVNRPGADRQDKRCGSRCSSPSLPSRFMQPWWPREEQDCSHWERRCSY